MKRLFAAAVFLFLATCSTAFPYQFEDYQWGSAIGNVSDQVAQKGKTLIGEASDEIEYKDQILDLECTVNLVFTPKTKLLWSITVIWNDAGTVDKMLKILTDKYGKPQIRGIYYRWGDPSNDCILLYVEKSQTKLIYYGKGLINQYKKELDELEAKDKGKF